MRTKVRRKRSEGTRGPDKEYCEHRTKEREKREEIEERKERRE